MLQDFLQDFLLLLDFLGSFRGFFLDFIMGSRKKFYKIKKSHKKSSEMTKELVGGRPFENVALGVEHVKCACCKWDSTGTVIGFLLRCVNVPLMVYLH